MVTMVLTAHLVSDHSYCGGVAQWLAAFGMNQVNARRARLVLGWVIVFGRVYHLGM